jgi:hypothetical protein
VGRELNTHSLTFPGMGKRQGGTFDRKERALAAAVAAGKKGKKEEGKKKQASKQASKRESHQNPLFGPKHYNPGF